MKARTLPLVPLFCSALAACNPMALSLLGAGAGVGVNHQMNGVAARTFSQPLEQVHEGILQAVIRMDIRLVRLERSKTAETLLGSAGDRQIEIEAEALTATTTRMTVVARRDLLTVDGATAQEIVAQTERALPAASALARAGGSWLGASGSAQPGSSATGPALRPDFLSARYNAPRQF